MLDKLIEDLQTLHQRDSKFVADAIARINFLANHVEVPDDVSQNSIERCRFILEQFSNQKAFLNVNHIASAFLDKDGLKHLIG